MLIIHAVNIHRILQDRLQSSYAGSFASRFRDAGSNNSSLLRELYKSAPDRAIRIFETQPSLHSDPSALSAYIKALVKADRLEESSLLRSLQGGELH